MAPRQKRISPQPSMDEQSSWGGASAEATRLMIDNSQQQQLLQQQQQPTSDSCTNNTKSNNNKTKTGKQVSVELVSDLARQQHDYFNLVALIFVIASASIDWNYDLLFQGMGVLAFNGSHYWWTWSVVNLYFLVDLVWVSQIPHCVKSPRTIIMHHLAVICYMLCPSLWPQYRWFVGPLLSVEINTWFLILRRVVYKGNITMLADAVSFSFYVSWIVIRCGVYPAVLVHMLDLANRTIRETGKLWHWPMIFVPVHFALCCLNAKWSYDLFYPIVESWIVPDAAKPTVSNGL